MAHVRGVRQRPPRARSASGSTTYRAAIGEMLAPMTRDRGARTRTPGTASSATAAEIVDARPDNRMVGYPYTKYMVVGDGRRHGRRARRSPPTSAPTRSASRPTGASTCAAGATRAIPCSSPSIPTSRARRRWRPRARRRSRSPGVGIDDVAYLRPLLVLRELAALRVRRARHRADRSRGAHRHRRAAVPRRSGERLPHALDRGDGRAAARRARRDRARERRRHAHDQARLRRATPPTPGRRRAPRRDAGAGRRRPQAAGGGRAGARGRRRGRCVFRGARS